MEIGATPPGVRVVKLRRAGWSGRYFPKSGTVVVRVGKRRCVGAQCDPDLRRELLAHELSHWAARVKHCGEERARARKYNSSGQPRKSKKRARTCKSYKGEHNAKFYKVLDRVNKFFKNSKWRAKLLEKRAGYHPPPEYMR
jgi:hypothetical protein